MVKWKEVSGWALLLGCFLGTLAHGVPSIIGDGDDAVDFETYLVKLGPKPKRLRRIAAAGNSVAHLGGCTAWLLTPRYLVTNQHCVKYGYKTASGPMHPLLDDFTASQCENLEIVFANQTPAPGVDDLSYHRPPAKKFKCRRFVVGIQALDFAIIEMTEPAPSELRPLRLARQFKPQGQRVLMIGHPDGKPKQIVDHNEGRDQAGSCFARPASPPPGRKASEDPHPYHRGKSANSYVHTCDSIPGSSGSPLLDARTLEVVGLHWNGWSNCKWLHYHPDGIKDDTNFRLGRGDSDELQAAHKETDDVPYRMGNLAVSVEAIRAFLAGLPTGDKPGQLPAEIKRVLR